MIEGESSAERMASIRRRPYPARADVTARVDSSACSLPKHPANCQRKQLGSRRDDQEKRQPHHTRAAVREYQQEQHGRATVVRLSFTTVIISRASRVSKTAASCRSTPLRGRVVAPLRLRAPVRDGAGSERPPASQTSIAHL